MIVDDKELMDEVKRFENLMNKFNSFERELILSTLMQRFVARRQRDAAKGMSKELVKDFIPGLLKRGGDE